MTEMITLTKGLYIRARPSHSPPKTFTAKMALRQLLESHEALKKRIHAFRIPLSPRGQMMAKCVYFVVPLVGGLQIMNWAIQQSEKHWEGVEKVEDEVTRQQNKALEEVILRARGAGSK
jgi:hypothetical protein